MPVKSARRQLGRELPDMIPLRNPSIPGGKKKLRGGQIGDELVPPPHAIEISGGVKINDGRGNIVDTEEAIKGGKKRGRPSKNLKGSGILDTLGSIASTAAPFLPLLALGKKKPGRPPKNAKKMEAAGIFSDIGSGLDAVGSILGLGKDDSFVGVKSGQGKKCKGGIQSGALPVTMTNALEQTTGGKCKAKGKRIEHRNEMMDVVSNLEAGIKELKKSVKKMK